MNKRTTTFGLLSLFCLILATQTRGNNIQITNVTLTGKDVSAGQNNAANHTFVQFDLSWDNSWRTGTLNGTSPGNYDAAWVFIKFRSFGAWQHAKLSTDSTLHIAPTGCKITPTSDGVGVFIYRGSDGSGDNNWTSIQLRWNYPSNSLLDTAQVEVRVFGIEVVYVPQGAFYVGSGGTEAGSFTDGSWTSGATTPFQITSEGALGIDNVGGKLWGTSQSGYSTIGNALDDAEATLPADFPKGYKAFYCMKYEISQGQYADFLNTLTASQQSTRAYIGGGNRNAISKTNNVYSSSKSYVSCNNLSWADGAAYCDWAGLRPMTELEFEKACRGVASSAVGEFAWGTNKIAQLRYTVGSENGSSESITEYYNTSDSGNALVSNTVSLSGPLRVGIFAAQSSGTEQQKRVRSGASYWGIMELSGTLWERCVTIGNAKGRSFTGVCGDGALDGNGDADATNWPNIADADGSGLRGGSWGNASIELCVSWRNIAAYPTTGRLNVCGFRGVR